VCYTGIISPTSTSQVGDWSTTSVSHVEDLQPATTSHLGGTSLVTTCHTGIISPTYASQVGDWSTTYVSHVEYLQPAAASHVGGTSPVIVCHTCIISPTSTSHVGYWSTNSAIHVEDLQPVVASHVGGTCLVTSSHTAHPSPTYAIHGGDPSPTSSSHVGDFLLVPASHAGSMSPATTSHVGGIHMIDKPRCLRRRPRFLCRICEGSHLTRLCLVTTGIPEAWGSPKGPLGYEASMVSQHSVPSLVDTTVMPMKSSVDTPFPLGVYASFDLVVSHHLRPTSLLCSGVMCLLTLLSLILFNQCSCRCNLRSTTLLFLG
jgi:hypothetical protein